MRSQKLILLLSASFLLYVYQPSYIFAEENEDIKLSIQEAMEQQMEIEGEILDLHEELNDLNMELNVVWQTIRDYDEKLTALSNYIDVYREEYEKQMEKVDALKEELKQIEVLQERSLNYFKKRARALYQSHPHYHLDVLFGSTSFSDFIARMHTMKKIFELDQEIYLNYQSLIESLKEQKKEIEYETTLIREKKEQLEEINKHFQDLQEEKKIFLIQLKQNIQEKEKRLKEKKEEKTKYKQKEEELKRELERRERLLNEVKHVQPSSFYVKGNGLFIMPTQGRFTSGFGLRWGRMHNGIDIANRIGTSVVAAADGTVKWAHYVDGYGNTVLLSHQINGRTYETLYAHLDKISVKVGQKVNQGMEIGKMGNTGFSTGPHLHFEIHVGRWNQQKTNAVDPLKLLSQ